ncbi:helix-turn-helix domain-containing protein [Streptomyces sp. NPDC087851]|uniref:helix-turn-helix domain-containing protein n=1 Tax=Streptomyces sp. NPDC087851 TaxID=3365810 RepID=UPI0038095CEB
MASPPRRSAKHPLDHEPEAVTYARKKAGLTMTDLADRLGVSLSLVSEIEGGTRNASPVIQHRMAEILNCPVVILERKREVTTGSGSPDAA